MGVTVGVDVGGTFTDLFVWDEDTKEFRIAKCLSTPRDPAIGILNVLKEAGVSLKVVELIVHGTTVATNAAIERMGARCALITTKGFRDIIDLRRRDKPTLYGMRVSWEPLIPRCRRYEVEERVTKDGEILREPSEDEIKLIAKKLIDERVESVVVAFYNGYANPSNERKTAEILRSYWPEGYIIVASEVVPEYREFERVSTAVTNAYVQPKIESYLSSLEKQLKAERFRGDIAIVHSGGGIMTLDIARKFPVRTLVSGPSAGVVIASHIAEATGYRNVITCDMGGTSFDTSAVKDATLRTLGYKELTYGVPLLVSQIDVITIGAGGGSIAWINRGGILQVGPRSAGADPGPACHGKGGKEPTVTDANLILGRMDSKYPIGRPGELTLDVDLARKVTKEKIADPLGLTIEEAALSIIKVVNAKMAGNIRLISIARGYDPRDFALIVFGGAGPLHANALMKDLEISKAIIPLNPGIVCAMGCMLIPFQYNFVEPVHKEIDSVDMEKVQKVFLGHAKEGKQLIEKKKEFVHEIEVSFQAEMHYKRQTHYISVPLPKPALSRQELVEIFERVHKKESGELVEGATIHVVNLRTFVTGLRRPVDLKSLAPGGLGLSLKDAWKDNTKVYFDGEKVDCDLFERSKIPPGAVINGPAVIIEASATTLIEPDSVGEVDEIGSIIIRRK